METGPAALAIRAGQEIGAAGETLGLAGLMPSLHFQFSYGWRENDSAALDDYRAAFLLLRDGDELLELAKEFALEQPAEDDTTGAGTWTNLCENGEVVNKPGR